MVQRKVSNKLGICLDHVKSEKRLANLKASFQHQDSSKNKGADLKKKMKKSRSFRLSDINSPRSSTMKRISLPGKPPPRDVLNTSATPPQKLSSRKTNEGSPNYMKSTSSADARRGSSLVSSHYYQSVSDSKLFSKRNSSSSKTSSASGNKPTRTLTKPSSLKLVRSLTKIPSFKNSGSTAKRCSRVALCADMNVQRATCSSTMKDTNFPPYLVLAPGGTESEGTSAEKVCPYTYCSLNGHHHSPVPPLKLFLSAKRRSLKAQRSFKVEALSPRRKMPADNETDKAEAPGIKTETFTRSTASALMQEVDCFIEIYAGNKTDGGGATKGNKEENEKGKFVSAAGFGDSDDLMTSSVIADDQQVTESLSDGSPQSEIEFEENLEQDGEIILADEVTAESFPEAEKYCQFNLDKEELESKSFGYVINPESENHENITAADISSEATDMDWEDAQLLGEVDYVIKMDLKSHSGPEVDDEPDVKTNNIEGTCHEEIHCNKAAEDIFDGESGCSETLFADFCQDQDVNQQDAEHGNFKFSQFTSLEEIYEEFGSTGEEDPAREVTATQGIEETSKFPGADNSHIASQQEDDQIKFSSETVEAVSDKDANKDLQGSRIDIWVNNLISDAVRISETKKSELDEEKAQEISDHNIAPPDFSSEQKHPTANSGEQFMEKEKVVDTDQDDSEISTIIDPFQTSMTAEDTGFPRESADVCNKSTAVDNCITGSDTLNSASSLKSEEQNDRKMNIFRSYEDTRWEIEQIETEADMMIDSTETTPAAETTTGKGSRGRVLHSNSNQNQELPDNYNNLKWTTKTRRDTEDWEEPRNFNPREPNYLPVVPDPDAEKVDLRHQDLDERKNSEEWMLDYALQQTVNKLAPAKKRKVALLVEAFETVMPVNKCDTRVKNASPFLQTRPIQACS